MLTSHEPTDSSCSCQLDAQPVSVGPAPELAGSVADDFALDWVYTRTAPAGATRAPGRVDAGTIADLTLPPDREPLIYVCGPTGFVESVASILVRRGHRADRIRTERFGGL